MQSFSNETYFPIIAEGFIDNQILFVLYAKHNKIFMTQLVSDLKVPMKLSENNFYISKKDQIFGMKTIVNKTVLATFEKSHEGNYIVLSKLRQDGKLEIICEKLINDYINLDGIYFFKFEERLRKGSLLLHQKGEKTVLDILFDKDENRLKEGKMHICEISFGVALESIAYSYVVTKSDLGTETTVERLFGIETPTRLIMLDFLTNDGKYIYIDNLNIGMLTHLHFHHPYNNLIIVAKDILTNTSRIFRVDFDMENPKKFNRKMYFSKVYTNILIEDFDLINNDKMIIIVGFDAYIRTINLLKKTIINKIVPM